MGGCAVAWYPDGSALISGHFTNPIGNPSYGVARYFPSNDPDGGYPNGTFFNVVYSSNGTAATNGASAYNACFNDGVDVAIDPTGRPVLTDRTTDDVYALDYTTGIDGGFIDVLAGNGSGGYSGDLVPASQIELNQPWGVLFTSEGHMVISDGPDNSSYGCLRELY